MTPRAVAVVLMVSLASTVGNLIWICLFTGRDIIGYCLVPVEFALLLISGLLSLKEK